MGDGVFEQVALDGGGEDRSVPFEQGRDGEPGGLAGPGRSDDGDRMLGFGGDQFPVDGAEGETSRLWTAYQEGFQVSGFRPPGPVVVVFSSVSLPETPPVSGDDGCGEGQEDEYWVVGGGSGNQPDGFVRRPTPEGRLRR